MKKKVLLFPFLLGLTGCQWFAPTPNPTPIEEDTNPKSVVISVANNPLMINAGSSLQLTAKVNPEKADQSVVWSTSNTECGTISESGLFTALADGRATITAASAKNSEIKDTYQLAVNEKFKYNKVENYQDDWSGQYLIVGGTRLFNSNSIEDYKDVSSSGSHDIDIFENEINHQNSFEGFYSQYEFTVEKISTGYSIKSSSNLYIGSESNNKMSISETKAYSHDLSSNISFDYTNAICGNMELAYNKSSKTFEYIDIANTSSNYCAVEFYKRLDKYAPPVNTDTIKLNSYTFSLNGSYQTGNYELVYRSPYTYGAYRMADYYGNMGILYDHLLEGDNSLRGALWNEDAINGIYSLEITYESYYGIKVSYGNTMSCLTSETLPSHVVSDTETVIIKRRAPYFKIETNGSDAYIESINIVVDNDWDEKAKNIAEVTTGKRIEPTVFNGALMDGVSQVTMPTKIDVKGSTYTVLETKTYTYYSWDYVSDHYDRLDLSKVAMTDPVDVANYYIAFREIPANYGYKGDFDGDIWTVSQARSIFHSDARQISSYTRTDGYAQSVGWRKHSGSYPLYYEFDIDVDGNYSSSRGVGRVVMWVDGFNDYGQYPVATLTDDHYCTFQEYLNCGQWGQRFDAQLEKTGTRVNRDWKKLETITLV